MLCSLPHSGNRDQLFKFLNQCISMTSTAFKRPNKKLGMCNLFILGPGARLSATKVFQIYSSQGNYLQLDNVD